MNKVLGQAAFALGAAALAWVAHGYLGNHPLALTITLLIAAVYAMGGLELQRFRQATASLHSALEALPDGAAQLGPWLAGLHPSLRNAVRLRIEGERAALPGPVMTPYLVGLLVLLGMLGTFLGMVVTLNGAVMALQTTSDLPAMRAALAAPVKGLGLAFGTSVAGVAASAMLGLVSALCRRERLQAAQALDLQIGSALRAFSRAHQRQATLDDLQRQASVLPQLAGQMQALPELVTQVQALMAQLARQGDELNQRLLAGQQAFHQQTQARYAELAASVDRSLQHSLVESARIAGAVLQPVAEATLAGIARETAALQRSLGDAARQQLDGLGARLDGAVSQMTGGWTAAMERQQQQQQAQADDLQQTLAGLQGRFAQGTAALLDAVDRRQAESQQRWQASAATLAAASEDQSARWLASLAQAQAAQQQASAEREQQRLVAWTASLQTLADTLRSQAEQAAAQALAQQQQICQTLAQTAGTLQAQARDQARDTIAEMARLVDTASQAPRAAAELVGQLRQQLSASLARDNGMLEERGRLLATLGTLLDAVNQAATDQRSAIDALVASSAAMLQQAGARFDQRIEAESSKLATAAAEAAGSAIEVASLGEAFGAAVQQFGDASASLVGQLQGIEAALAKSGTRSDEQLAYYVAQAREIVDLSISSQRQIVDDLQQLAIRQQPLAAAEAS